jgi:glycerate 2-kinase
VLAIGKAAAEMFQGVQDHAGAAATWEGLPSLMVIPCGYPGPPWALRADHPLPTQRNVEAARKVADFAARMRPGDHVLILLSGGASALLTLPAPGLTLDDLRSVTARLLAGGAAIHEINCIRKHTEQLKGGRLAQLMSASRLDVLVLSDVIGNDLSVIGSGPFTPDTTSPADAAGIVRRFAPDAAAVLKHLECAGDGSYVPAPAGTRRSTFQTVEARIIGDNTTALAGARAEAERLGYTVVHAESGITGEAAEVGERLARLALAARAEVPTGRACIIFGGETTVTLPEAHGRGGRNQELVLAAALALDRHPGITVGAIGTDGVDGPTDAAGAIADGALVTAARRCGLDARESLQRHDSYTLFAPLEALIRTGPTGTNVNDIAIGLISPAPPATLSVH